MESREREGFSKNEQEIWGKEKRKPYLSKKKAGWL